MQDMPSPTPPSPEWYRQELRRVWAIANGFQDSCEAIKNELQEFHDTHNELLDLITSGLARIRDTLPKTVRYTKAETAIDETQRALAEWDYEWFDASRWPV